MTRNFEMISLVSGLLGTTPLGCPLKHVTTDKPQHVSVMMLCTVILTTNGRVTAGTVSRYTVTVVLEEVWNVSICRMGAELVFIMPGEYGINPLKAGE